MATAATRVTAAAPSKARREVLDLSHYATYFFTVLANKLSSGASRLYLRRFGIGIIEWRVMAMLAIEPRIAPARISQVIGLDKASISRESRKLEEKGYLIVSSDETSSRRKTLELSPKGYELHDQVIQVALERERRLLSDLTSEEADLFLDLLARTTAKIPYVNEFDPGSTAATRTPNKRRGGAPTRLTKVR
ncbi:MarR family winged helix-turn-helix transcriptional regulator [Ramlibacter rhizophilus]|uniref:MarR family transcriptional regulator n=1 Tax=Ramlibacter rhizophilus TaxID=1781167 RepID=A0A4Z0BX12_9BURK|nr:MarR family transcriptional regulator [Ramlibacter rhizophilus]TFZ03441.1 MarR family transcriptional regulator [Ramlibacter rhizophilus]